MKIDRLKKISVRAGVVFFLIIAILTYFSSSIEIILLPKVKTTEVQMGTLVEDESAISNTQNYIVPLSAVSGWGNDACVYTIHYDESGKSYVRIIFVDIANQSNIYCEIISDSLYLGMPVIYQTTKDIENGDRVYVEEEHYDS